MNGRYIRQMTDEELGQRLVEYLTRIGFYDDPQKATARVTSGPGWADEAAELLFVAPPSSQQDWLTRAVAPLVKEKVEVLADFVAIAGWFFRPLTIGDDARARLAATPEAARTLAAAAQRLEALSRVGRRAGRGRRARPARGARRPRPKPCSRRCAWA